MAEEVKLATLTRGARFAQRFETCDAPPVTGVVIEVLSGSVLVELDGTADRRVKREHWSLGAFVEPTGEVADLTQQGEGGIMATKKEKKARRGLLYSVVAEKKETKAGQDLLAKDNASHRSIVFRCLNGMDRPVSASELITFIDRRQLKTEAKDFPFLVRKSLLSLKQDGFVRAKAPAATRTAKAEEKTQAA